MQIKKFFLLLLLCFIFLSAKYDEHNFSQLFSKNIVIASVGPVWANFNSLESAQYKNDSSLLINSDYKINVVRGVEFSTFSAISINKYFCPAVIYSHRDLNGGSGSINVYNSRNFKFVNTVECHDFIPHGKSNYFALGNYSLICEKEFIEKPLKAYFFVGYNIEKSNAIADWDTDSSLSCSTWYGAVLGIVATYFLSKDFIFLLSDYIYPDRIKTYSTRNSLLGEESGYQTFMFFSNYLSATIIYNLQKAEDIGLGLSLAYGYSKNVGTTCTSLSIQDSKLYQNPKLSFAKSNFFSMLFSFYLKF